MDAPHDLNPEGGKDHGASCASNRGAKQGGVSIGCAEQQPLADRLDGEREDGYALILSYGFLRCPRFLGLSPSMSAQGAVVVGAVILRRRLTVVAGVAKAGPSLRVAHACADRGRRLTRFRREEIANMCFTWRITGARLGSAHFPVLGFRRQWTCLS
jgi:hypothetical protein